MDFWSRFGHFGWMFPSCSRPILEQPLFRPHQNSCACAEAGVFFCTRTIFNHGINGLFLQPVYHRSSGIYKDHGSITVCKDRRMGTTFTHRTRGVSYLEPLAPLSSIVLLRFSHAAFRLSACAWAIGHPHKLSTINNFGRSVINLIYPV
ncbi:hypothetical protein PILCRDRAFT_476399 [Piloderma croceum F 1598]|uniref:Uncharacterized protein n=1 Tax=Piloderma croceum (strain F 1598) TaxID=765440 RepID=A0A0C3FRH1_PILCF|nr:hypothetical protein PILCRDRAFT_476399 [Piloderma croceum F 1598]